VPTRTYNTYPRTEDLECMWVFHFINWRPVPGTLYGVMKSFLKKYFLFESWRSLTKIAGSGSISQIVRIRTIPKCHGSATLLFRLIRIRIQQLQTVKLSKKIFFVWILKVTDENSRIRIH
jgi:hypothetical protein